MKHGLLILVHGHFLFKEHGQIIVAVTALVACADQKNLQFQLLLRW